MRNKVSILIVLFLCCSSYAQFKLQKVEAFSSYEEFKNSAPTLEFNLQLKLLSQIDFQGGIGIYILKNSKPAKNSDKISREIWGFSCNDTIYINTFHVTNVKGYNVILENGYYKYFLGRLPPNEKLQKEFGIFIPKPTWYQSVEYGIGGYVLLPDGKIKFLSPELLAELCKDNEKLYQEIVEAKLNINDQKKIFEFLKQYNKSK
jgi:hypothetical protein